MKGTKYVVAYWNENETYEDATDFDMSIYQLAAAYLVLGGIDYLIMFALIVFLFKDT